MQWLFLAVAGFIGYQYLLKGKLSGGGLDVPVLAFNPNAPVVDSNDKFRALGNTLSNSTGIPGFSIIANALSGLFGQGRKEADNLVQKYQNPLGDYLAQLIGQWNKSLEAGVATEGTRQQLLQLLAHAEAQFIAESQRFPKAGPGGRETIRHVIHDILIPDIVKVSL
jgi:hypothetical protein